MASAAPEDDIDIKSMEKSEGEEEFDKEDMELIDDSVGAEKVEVPSIIVEDVSALPELENSSPMRCKSENLTFPLSHEDKTDLVKLLLRFAKQEYLAGLSAPQIGINKRAFVFEIPPDEDNQEEQAFPKSLWINPTYRNADGATLDEDYESCFSIKTGENNFAIGPVFRFNKIFYRAYDTEGKIMEGEAKGYAARVIQHEIDHLDGKLYADYVQPDRMLSLPQYGEKLEAGTLDELQKGIVPEFL